MRLLNALASQIGANVGFDSTATGLRFHLLMERMRGPNVEILGCVHQPHVSAL
jgi:hypothetical protein